MPDNRNRNRNQPNQQKQQKRGTKIEAQDEEITQRNPRMGEPGEQGEGQQNVNKDQGDDRKR